MEYLRCYWDVLCAVLVIIINILIAIVKWRFLLFVWLCLFNVLEFKYHNNIANDVKHIDEFVIGIDR